MARVASPVWFGLLGSLLLPAVSSAQSEHAGHPGTPGLHLGTISFPTSGSAPAQAEFLLGVLYLHSFEYPSAERAFQRAQSLEPDFAMAYWGEAMTYTHAVWNEQDTSSGRGALERLAASPAARRAKAPTAREQAYLGAVELLYGSGSKPRRDTLYAEAMEHLVRDYPEDLEAKAFYALALLGLNQGIRDTVTYLRAAPYADTVYRANRDHPGAVHYLIHSYDDPIHAHLGLEAARSYARIAPDAAHAQHMTTHIFLAMGMWDDVVSQNRIAVGLTASVPGHYTSWLVYGLIQQGRYDAARNLLDQLRGTLGDGTTPGRYTALAEMRAHFLLNSEDWSGPIAGWRLNRDRMTVPGKLIDTFTDGVMAYRRRNAGELATAAAEVARLAEAVRTDRGPNDPVATAGRIMARELGSMQVFLGGSRDAAVRALREAAALEDAMPMEFGPPAIAEPTHEILALMLLEMQPTEALEQYRRALALAPGRSRALLGAIRAAIAVGDKAAAQSSLDQITENWRNADPKVRDDLIALRRSVGRMH